MVELHRKQDELSRKQDEMNAKQDIILQQNTDIQLHLVATMEFLLKQEPEKKDYTGAKSAEQEVELIVPTEGLSGFPHAYFIIMMWSLERNKHKGGLRGGEGSEMMTSTGLAIG